MKDNGWCISDELIAHIKEILPKGSTILELGSGDGTGILAKYYQMHSIEHNAEYLGKHKSNYIYAPLVNGWYDLKTLRRALPLLSYDLILVDGPPGNPPDARMGFSHNLHLFNTDVRIVFDDINRPYEKELAVGVAMILNKVLVIYPGKEKSFAVL